MARFEVKTSPNGSYFVRQKTGSRARVSPYLRNYNDALVLAGKRESSAARTYGNCIRCGNGFASEGKHNRMCQTCARVGLDRTITDLQSVGH